jgi:hypothetical protein
VLWTCGGGLEPRPGAGDKGEMNQNGQDVQTRELSLRDETRRFGCVNTTGDEKKQEILLFLISEKFSSYPKSVKNYTAVLVPQITST